MLVAMSCGNQMISSTFINYVSIDIICEELYQVVTQLVNRYLRKEYFSSNGICINSKYSVHNAFIALLLNICSNIPKYLRTLKAHLYNEMNQYPQSQMLVAAIEEMVDSNHQKYTAFVQEKLKNLSENLKLTTRSLFEQIRTLNFAVNDVILYTLYTIRILLWNKRGNIQKYSHNNLSKSTHKVQISGIINLPPLTMNTSPSNQQSQSLRHSNTSSHPNSTTRWEPFFWRRRSATL